MKTTLNFEALLDSSNVIIGKGFDKIGLDVKCVYIDWKINLNHKGDNGLEIFPHINSINVVTKSGEEFYYHKDIIVSIETVEYSTNNIVLIPKNIFVSVVDKENDEWRVEVAF